MSLKQFVEQENRFAAIYGKMGLKVESTVMDPNNLTGEQKKNLADRLASALSPENLCCDGELRGRALQVKTKMLQGAKKDLEAMGVTHDWW